MRSPAELIWCGAGSPVVQGMLLGLGAAVVGLVVFPFDFRTRTPQSGPIAGVARARDLVARAKWISAALAVLAALTITGYVSLFVTARGKFCTAPLSWRDQLGVDVWCGVAAASLALAITAGGLRWWVRRSNSGG